MNVLRRVLAVAATVLLAVPAVARADEGTAPVTPVRRISCPTAEQVSKVSGYDLSSLTATRASCWYESAPTAAQGLRQRVEFTYTKDAGLAAARSRVEAWQDATIRSAVALGPEAFSWESAGPANVYWEVSPGAVGTLSGVDDHAKAVATAELFRPQMEVYTVPGERTVGGRKWRTTCEPYSETTRCRTEIWAHTVVPDGASFRRQEGWTFNSLTYLWSKRALWAHNPLATDGTWRADGRVWRTECDTAVTGRGACRTWLRHPTVEVASDGEFVTTVGWVFNNQVLFS
ncbi:hypothetical protein [Tessaracoccus sp. MC1756]|uniref:hypothetical protein n=1 Tax=Tessaracoccus sp. MC1756 TaxID=2760311 RepID=UPI0016007312|nr:hypothetical protein [Tessaracoccus sp. MC1756]MBB1510342.1 hypothetical protein [Tessaracoccus sp. MC1756]